MFIGRYIRWNPIPLLEGKRMYCEAVHDDWDEISHPAEVYRGCPALIRVELAHLLCLRG